jgi:hypothetical protein
MENKIFLASELVTLKWSDSNSEYASARKLIVLYGEKTADFILDERVNDIFLTNPKSSHEKSNLIYKKFYELCKSDFRYQFGDGYEGVSLKLETFIEFLKQEDRNSQLNKILC